MANQVLYGLHNYADVAALHVTEVGVDVVNTAVQQAREEHNRQVDALMGLFVRKTTDFKLTYKTTSTGRLQPLDENGRARPIQVAGKYDVAFPIQHAGTAWGANRIARAKMTVQDVNDITASLLMADMRWVRDHILAALFTNVTWSFTDPEHGALTIQPLANNDSVVYQYSTGADSGATDNHFVAQANAIDNSNDPFPALYLELMEHPENAGEVVATIPTGLRASVEALSGFYPTGDSRIRLGANQAELVGTLGVAVPGEIIGYHDSGVWIAEWRAQPANYIVATTTQGEKAIAMREHPEAELQGFSQTATREDHPFWESQWERLAGFGAWNRVGAAVVRVGNGTYAIPTNYSSPMA